MLRRSIRGFEAEANSSEADEDSLENGSIGLTEITPNSNSPQVEAPENADGKPLALEKLYPAQEPTSNEASHTISPFKAGSTVAEETAAAQSSVSFGDGLKNPLVSETKTQVDDDIEYVRADIASTVSRSDADKKELIKERTKLINQVFAEKDARFRLSRKMKPASSTGKGPGLYSGAGMKQGEIQFLAAGNHRAYYLVCPEEMESTDAVLMHMFGPNNPVGWKLKPPALTVDMRGGRDHFSKWIETSYHDTEEGTDVWSGGTKEGMKDDARRMKFKRRLQEIAGGVCQAVVECGGWFDFNDGGRGGLAEVIKDGMKTYWASQSTLAGHKEQDLGVVIAIRSLESTTFSSDFEEFAIPLDTEEGTMNPDAIPTKLQSRVHYPNVNHLLFAAETGKGGGDEDEHNLDGMLDEHKSQRTVAEAEIEKEAMFAVSRGILNVALTHVVFVKNDIMLQKLKFDIANLATRATIFANGRKALIESGVDGYILNAASRGMPIVCLHHTGGAAEIFGKAILQRQQGKDKKDDVPGRYRLPENVSGDSCLVLDSSSDSVEKVIDKLTLVLSSVQDDEMREVGNNKSEKERLLHAWTTYVRFHLNASIQLKRAWIFHIMLILCNILTTVLALLYFAGVDNYNEECTDGNDEEVIDLPSWLSRETLANILPILPVLSGMILTISSKFSPILKWSSLYSNAEQIKSEIYMYRARVGDYTPRVKNNIDVMSKVKNMEEARKQAMMQRAVGSGAGQMNFLMNFDESASSQGSKNKESEDRAAKLEARRTVFANKISAINRVVMASEVRSSHLLEPTPNQIKQTLKNLYSNISSPETSSLNLLGSHADTEDPSEIDTITDNGVAVLTAADYCQLRLQPLIAEYKARSPVLSRRLGSFHFVMVVLTALTTGLAMTPFRLWVPIVVSIGAAVATTLEWEQLLNRHRNVNKCLEELTDLYTWWESLSMVEKRMPKFKEHLVFATENNNDAEISAFVKSTVRLGTASKGSDGDNNDGDSAEEEENIATL